MLGNKRIPHRDELRSYDHAVAGHDGTLCDADGELFIKPCTQSEIDFYQSAQRRHPEFADLMPVFMGTLMLSDPKSIEDEVAGVISEAGNVQTSKPQFQEAVAEQVAKVAALEPTEKDNVTWTPNSSKRIKTDQAVVLGNASHGFKYPNILDVKLGVRLWADDAPLEKKRRFDKISSETTHGNLGFRIAGMRVYRGSKDASQLNDDDYKTYDKDYGKVIVNENNVVREFRKFIFNMSAGVDEELGQAVCAAFLQGLKRAEDILTRHESRMYSSSLLFIMEGDGDALRKAIEDNNDIVQTINDKAESPRTTKRVDSGIALGDEDGSELEEEFELSSLPRIYELKLIDFAHAQWTPGQGPDENTLTGVRSLLRIFEEMMQ